MAKGTRISGIYIPITLDTSAIQGDLTRLKNELGRAGESMMKAFGGNLESRKLMENFVGIQKAVGQLRDSFRALEALKPMGSFEQTLLKLRPQLRDLGQSLGLTVKAQRELLTRMAENQAINQQVNALRTLEKALGTTREETVKLAASYGLVISQAAQERYLGNNATEVARQTNEVRKLVDEYKRLAQLSGQTRSRENFLQYFNRHKIQEAVDAFRKLNPNIRLTAQYYQQIAQAAGVATAQVAAFMREQEREGGRGILGIFTPSNLSAGLQSALSAAGVITGMYGIVELGKASIDASLKMDNITKAFESIYNSGEKAANQIQFIRDTSQRLGLSFIDTAEAAKGLFASAQGTILEKDANKIFTAFSNAGAALKLTSDEMSSIFLALSQSMSKGKLSAEEIRQQLAERLPGAVTLLAKSMGVTTRELDKMFQDGAVGLENLSKLANEVQRKYSERAQLASTGLQAELNRVSNAWFELKKSFIDSDALAVTVRRLGTALQYVANHSESITVLVTEFAKLLGTVASVYALIRAVTALSAAFTALKVAMAEGGIAGFVATLGPAGIGIAALSAAIGGLLYTFSKLGSGVSEADRLFDTMKDRTFKLGDVIKGLTGDFDDLNEKAKEEQLTELQKKLADTQKQLELLFERKEIKTTGIAEGFVEAMLAGVDVAFVESRSRMEKGFADLSREMARIGQGTLGKSFEKSGMEMAQKLMQGIREGMSKDDLNGLFLEVAKHFDEFGKQVSNLENSENAVRKLNEIQNAFLGLANSARLVNAEIENTKNSNDELVDLLEKTRASFDAIEKITKTSGAYKENKLAEDIKTLQNELITIVTNFHQTEDAVKDLDQALDENADKFKNLQDQTEHMNDALPLLASYALKNGQDFQTMATSLMEAGIQAQFTMKQLVELHHVLQQAFNVEVGKIITDELGKLDLKIAQIGAKTKDKTALTIFSKVIKDSGDQLKAFNAIAKGDMAALTEVAKKWGMTTEQVESIIQKSTIFGTKSDASKGGSRRRSSGASRLSREAKQAQKDVETLQHALTDLDKKIGAFQSKISDDPSAKYWADVNAEITKINELITKQKGKNAELVAQIQQKRDAYKALAEERFKQMEEEERRQKAINALQMFGQGYGKLGEINRNASVGLNLKALAAQYEESLIEYKKMVAAKIVSEEEFNRVVEELNQERNIKEAQANGEMLASFTNALQQAAEEMQNWQDKVADMLVGAIEDMSDAFADFVVTGMKNTEDLGEAFKSLVDGMIKDLARLFMRMMIMSATSKIFGSLVGGGVGTAGGAATGGQWDWISARAAKGGVFAGGNISAFSGRVVTGPTIFSGAPMKAFAKGGNVMGEAGPEVILPLTKGSNGKLGVEATAGQTAIEMQQAISVNVYNNTDSQITTSQTTSENGDLAIQVVVEKMIGDAMTRAGSAPFRALHGTWGANPKLARRG